METAKNAVNYVSDTLSGEANKASKEANKEVAKDSNVGIGDRISAMGSAASDKASQHKDEASAKANKEAVKH